MNYHHLLDTKGLICPEPIMLLHKAIKDSQNGDVIKLIATDPASVRDVMQFCDFLDHQLLAQAHTDEQYVFYIAKA